MAPRLELHATLLDLMPENKKNVYFQPPAGKNMIYPCIVYNRSSITVAYADDTPHRRTKRYQVTYIDQDPDSDVPDKIGLLPMCSYDRFFSVDNLNHDVFNLYW